MAKILVIDDEEMIRSLLTKVIEREGMEVVVASDGQDGLAKFRTQPFDLVICDLIMPRTDGIETIAGIRKMAPEVKIIAMSGGGRRHAMEILKLAHDMGADHALGKPFGIDALVALIRRCLPGAAPTAS